jgi:hypothetical protein
MEKLIEKYFGEGVLPHLLFLAKKHPDSSRPPLLGHDVIEEVVGR